MWGLDGIACKCRRIKIGPNKLEKKKKETVNLILDCGPLLWKSLLHWMIKGQSRGVPWRMWTPIPIHALKYVANSSTIW